MVLWRLDLSVFVSERREECLPEMGLWMWCSLLDMYLPIFEKLCLFMSISTNIILLLCTLNYYPFLEEFKK